MTVRQIKSEASFSEASFGVSLFVSTVVHLAVFLLLLWSGQLFPVNTQVQETYYVDVVNLPVASPRAGSPTQKGSGLEAPPPPVQENRMTMPAPAKPSAPPKQQKADKAAHKGASEEESAEFAKKMAKLQGKAESREAEAAIERLSRKVASEGKGRSGMPAAVGGESGSRYEDYIKSRLEDALKKTSSYTTKNPLVVVRLTIASNGQISRKRIERSSGDHAFELAVLRAIDIVAETLIPPPDHNVFESGFIFRPQKISNTKP